MTSEEIVSEIGKVHAALVHLELGGGVQVGKQEDAIPVISRKQAFKKSEILCMVCGKGGMQTLARHLTKTHSMSQAEYRKKFCIPRDQALTAGDFSARRRAITASHGLAEYLVKARAVRLDKLSAKKRRVDGA